MELRGLSESSWAITQEHLTEGYWVLLVENDRVGDELARKLTGLVAPRNGIIRLNGEAPFNRPRARARCISVQMNESCALATTVRGSLARLAPFIDPDHDASLTLASFGLEHLADRTHDSLSSKEQRQVAFAATLARSSIDLAVYCEPCLDLSGPQLRRLQEHMLQLATHACVLCITASLHDARLLGGPHAQLTRSGGWAWVEAGADQESVVQLLIEGSELRPLAAHLALQGGVTELRMQQLNDACQMLWVSAAGGEDVTRQIATVARQSSANISRLCTGETLLAPGALPRDRQALDSQVDHPNPARNKDCNLVRIAWARQRELVTAALRSPAGLLLLLGEPLLTTVYAAGQRQLSRAGSLQNTLAFVVTYIVPLGSLLAVRVLAAESALGGMGEPLARLGARRGIVRAANSALTSIVSAAVAAMSAACAVLLTNTMSVSELGICVWIAVLGGAAYASIFSLINQPQRVWMPWIYLIADLWLGASALGVSVIFPHAHLANLMGLPNAPELAQWVSFVCLGAIILLASGLMLIGRRTINR